MAASCLALAASALAATPHESVAPVALVPYLGGQLSGVDRFTDLGRLPGTTPVSIDLAIARPDPAGEVAYKSAEYTPGNPLFHAYLTPRSFAEKFGVAVTTFDTALRFATAHGLALRSASPTRDLLDVTGTAAQAEATFGTTLEQYRFQGITFYANTTAPLVPSTVPFLGVFGLETMHRARTSALTRVAAPAQDGCTAATNSCTGALTPQDAWSIYDQPSTDTGQGAKVTILGMGAYNYVIKDLRQFETANHLPQVPVSVSLADGPDNGKNYTNTSGDGEWQLDTQSSTGMSPNATELDMVWGSAYVYPSILNMYSTWTNLTNGTMQADASFGDCEPFAGSPATAPAMFDVSTVAYVQSSEQVLSQAAMEGKTLFSSSGDTGSSCGPLPVDLNGTNEVLPGVEYPSSSVNVVGVGGTVLHGTVNTATAPASNATRSTEYAWDDGGGGPSAEFPEPPFQSKDTGTANNPLSPLERPDTACTYTTSGALETSGPTCRKVPDVSAAGGTSYAIIDDGSAADVAGTSLASPMTMGLWTRIQSASCAVSPTGVTGLGFADYQFYSHPADFFDPGGATNSMIGTNGEYTSAAGYDEVTGLGVIDVTKLMKDLDGGSTVPCVRAAATTPAAPVAAAADPAVAASKAVATSPKAKTRRTAARARRTTIQHARPKQPTRTLAFTGLDTDLAVLALLLVTVAVLAARARRAPSPDC